MLVYNPVNRIPAKDMLKHPYFDDVNKKTLPAGEYEGDLFLPSALMRN